MVIKMKKIDDELELQKKKKIYEIEKKLGRHKNDEEKKNKKNNKIIKYILIVNNLMYTLAFPILIMLGAYIFLEKKVFKKQQPIVLIVFLIIGVFSGYWSLVKQMNNINKK